MTYEVSGDLIPQQPLFSEAMEFVYEGLEGGGQGRFRGPGGGVFWLLV